MEPTTELVQVADTIRTAVTPVFLLVGISGLLTLLSNRLARVIDRKRHVDAGLFGNPDDGCSQSLAAEARRLRQRIRLVNWSIRACVASALAVCLVIVALFLGEVIAVALSSTIAVLFVTAMALMIAGLVFLLGEVQLATRQPRDGMENCLER